MEIVLLLALYGLPAIVSAARGHPNQNSIFILNLLLGWTIIGWIVALVWAFSFVAPADRAENGLLFGPQRRRDSRWDDLRS